MSNKGRKDRGSNDYELVDKLKQENKKLKNQVQSLRKQLARIDLDRFQNVKELIEKYDRLEQEELAQQSNEELKEIWRCRECKAGHLVMMTFEKADGVYYFRKCTECSHRTKMQRLTANTKPGPKD